MRRTGRPLAQKVVDDTIYLKRPRRGAMLKEEVWHDQDGQVVKYSLAYVVDGECVHPSIGCGSFQTLICTKDCSLSAKRSSSSSSASML